MSEADDIKTTLPEGDLSRGVSRRLTQEQRDQNRIERMTVAAFELFTEHGYANTTIEMLCSASNVSTRDFYKLIKRRDVLLKLVYERVFSHVESCVLLALAKEPPDNHDRRLNSAIDALVHAYTSDPRYARLAYIEVVGVSDEIEAMRRMTHEKFAALIRREFDLRTADTDQSLDGKLPLAIVGACNELIIDWLGTQPHAPADVLSNEIKQLYEIVLKGLSAG